MTRRQGWALAAGILVAAGCGYTTRPGLASHLRTIYVKPFVNKIDLSQLSSGYDRFPVYRHAMEVELTKEVINRFQFTGLLRPTRAEEADCRLEGELVEYRRDPLRYTNDKQVEEWRLNLVVNLRFYDRTQPGEPVWEEERYTGDTTYVAVGAGAESETTALTRATQDLARRIVERTVENW